MQRRVAVTGVGVISPIGIGKDVFWENLLNGVSGVSTIEAFDATNFPVRIAGEVKDFHAEDYLDRKEARRMDRNTQFAVAAAKMALEDSNIELVSEDADRMGVVVGTGIGGIITTVDVTDKLREKGPSRVGPFAIPMMIANMAAGQVSIALGAKGPVVTEVTACASGTNAVGSALHMIRSGVADVIFAGGTEAAVDELPMAAFAAMKALSTKNDEPEKASRPFDASRDGFVLGEGAGMLVLEEWEHAKARGAKIYAELCGYGTNGDAYHITAPAPEGIQAGKCMELAIQDAGLNTSEIDYINAHGTSTPLNDKNESIAIRRVFGDHADHIAVNSTKSMTGHLLGAAGAVEAVVLALSIAEGKVHKTLNLEAVDEECKLNYVTEGVRTMNVRAGLSNSFGFGGHNAVIAMKAVSEE